MKPETKFLALLAMLAKQSGEELDDFRGTFYLAKLRDFDLDRVSSALEKLLETSRRFPTIGEIKAAMGILEPTARDFAMLLVDRICTGFAKYGEILAPSTMAGAEAAMGPEAWTLIQRSGGWNDCLDRYGENPTTFRAQLRDAAGAYLATGQIEPEAISAALPPRSVLPKIGERHLEAKPDLPPPKFATELLEKWGGQ